MSILSSDERNRYQRQMQLPGIGIAGQQKLKSASVLVVGAGGLGCPVLTYLAAAGVGTIGIADHDTVAVSNLHRQPLYNHHDVGALKAKVAAQRLQQLNPHIQVMGHTQGLFPEDAAEIIASYDIVMDCTDRFDARYLMNDVCVLLDKPMIHGSLLRYQAQMAGFNYLLPDGSRSATYRCVFPDPPAQHEVTDCLVAGIFGFLPGMVGSWMAAEAVKLLLGMQSTAELLLLDVQTNSLQKMGMMRNPEVWRNAPKSAAEISCFDYGSFCARLT